MKDWDPHMNNTQVWVPSPLLESFVILNNFLYFSEFLFPSHELETLSLLPHTVFVNTEEFM